MVFSKFISESTQNHGADISIKSKARELRKRMTVAEKILWERLKNRQVNNMHFRRQHPFGIYIIDFYCHKASLAIEIDGKIHLRTMDKDNERSEYLRSSGLKVLRFNNEEVENNLEWVMDEIRKHLLLNSTPPGIIMDNCK